MTWGLGTALPSTIFTKIRRRSKSLCPALLCRISPKSQIKVEIMDRNSCTPLSKVHSSLRLYKMHNYRIIFADIRSILLTMDEENRASHLYPHVKCACDSTNLYETHKRWVASREDLHWILTLSGVKSKYGHNFITPLCNVRPFLYQFLQNSQLLDDDTRPSSTRNFIRNGQKV
jgi:hypothetical protein